MGKWLDIIPDEDLFDFAGYNYATYGWWKVKRVSLKDIGDAIKITWQGQNLDEHSIYFNDFFEYLMIMKQKNSYQICIIVYIMKKNL